ncbi:MAG: protein kinase domain-containing protein, partial [Thermoanaerobaculia bacterium]
MHLAAGALVGSYRILAPLGAGGMGEVYRARDEKLSRDVALKVLSGDLASSADHLRRFQQEAHAASATNHPNIITIYDIGRFDETAYIAMELVDGQDLRTMQAGERLPLKTILRIAVKVADGLAAAHERGIVHRDLKPENVMISRDGFVKILDFGLAKLVRPITQSETTAPHTTPGAVFGTVAYMSPEQAAGRPVDFRSDQFSLGVILFEMLSGRMPFNEATAAETLAAIIRRDAPAIPAVNDVPPELQRIVDRCLSKDPADRYASTRDLARDLREIRDRISNSSEPRHRSDKPALRGAGRGPLWAAGAGAVVLIVAVVMYQRHESDQPPVTPPRPAPTSVAMIPFRDLGSTPEGQIFTDGISEMISARLAESSPVRIVPLFDSVARASGEPRDLARRRGASLLVSGLVQREGDKVRITYSVEDAASGQQIDGGTQTSATDDLFVLEDRVAESILSAIHVGPAPRRKHTTTPELSSAADQKAYIEAVGLLQRASDEPSVDRAIATLERLLVNARDSAQVNALLGRALYDKFLMTRRPGFIEQANVYAERAAEIDRSLPAIHMTLGLLRNASGRREEAVAEFQRALELEPNQPSYMLALASTYDAMGRGADAEKMYTKAISADPQYASTYNMYGSFCFTHGRYEEAAKNFQKATDLVPRAPRYLSNLGGAYQALGRYPDALKAYERSIALSPTPAAYSNTGTIYYYLGQYPEACKAHEKAAQLAPGDYLVWLNLADTYRWTPGKR